MRIKRIELTGFKSFCDRLSLDMRHRITGIVGPNGCGKSNIVDALRWAMGEQSARHLRGKSMEDVIFNGSESRGPSGLAEVNVTFENDGRMPAEYLDYTEITISRRLHRDGTSEYIINKVPVRLRDITNLFLGTGVGTKAYSIIEQGRIGLIVSARPEDRRHFIEEAAGITKYQRRKRAAERKMEATRQNLLRVSDVLGEMESRLGSLRRQARKAERYKQYRTEMQEIELCAASHRFLEIVAETKYQQGEMERAAAARDERQAALEENELDLERARMEAMEKERELSSIQEQLYSLDNRVKLAESNIQFKEHEAAELTRQAEAALLEEKELSRQIEASAEDLEQARRRALELAAQRDLLLQDLVSADQRLAALRQEQRELAQALEGERADAGSAERVMAQAEATLRALDQRRLETRERLSRRTEETERVDERRAFLEGSCGELEGQLDDLRRSIEELVRRQGEIKARLQDLEEVGRRGEAELEVLRTELHRRRSRLASLREIEQRYERFSRGTRAVMQRLNGDARERGVLGLVADMVEAPAAYETALEAVLGQRIGTIIVENERVGLEAIEFLKSTAEGRSSFINRYSARGSLLARAPVGFVWEPGARSGARASSSAVAGGGGGAALAASSGVHGPILGLIQFNREYRQVAESLLGDVVVVENLDLALDLWETVEGRTLVTLEGEILGPDGTLTGGSEEAEMSGVLRQRREIKELAAIIAELEEQYGQALDRHLAVKTEAAALEQALQQSNREGHQGEKDLLAREKDRDSFAAEVEQLAGREQELEQERARLRQQLEEIDLQQQEQKREQKQSGAGRQLAGEMIYLLLAGEQKLAGQVEAAAATLTDLKVALADVEARWRAGQESVHRLEEMRRERAERIGRLQSGREEGLKRAGNLREEVEWTRQELRDLVTERAGAHDELLERRQGYEVHLARVGEREARLKQDRATVRELAEEAGRLQLRLSELDLTLRHLQEQVWERYREELRIVAGDHHLSPRVTDDQMERLAQLRQLIERMGEINLTAIEEFEELNGRFEFLSTHKKDLEDALAQLQRAISRINRTSRKRFRETFELVNEMFQTVFPRLFSGGRARLVLTDEDNLLETGVEIAAQPPGKKLQSIDLLSGGEKALTAVSLIFAMFMVKPTPFCLLDEVDAPLDEANVTRFNELVREMSDHSQFILITHNRRTMELSDALYGVTMEEPGISRLVSVNLSEGEALAEM